VVLSVVTACQKCKKFTSCPFRQPDNLQLPSFHLTEECRLFLYVGVDTCGHLIVEDRKYYILIFADLVCRAVDLEVLVDLTTEELLLAFGHFVARCCQLQLIVSNNAKQFVLLNSVLAASIKNEYQWKFSPEFSQWQGGVYERQIGVLK